ncbi:MAG: glycosyltransferase family 39 protein [Candidatus Aenigmarchaeota archaeon]|nr:glycosyltransferase family 39 protein [Candidatus Aenigmarchaeota archaeon]
MFNIPKLQLLKKLNPKDKKGKYKAEFWLLLIVLFALALRLWFFVGLVYTDEQDEGIYLRTALTTSEGRMDFSKYANLPKSFLPNPSEAFDFRTMVYYPPSIMFRLFGLNEFSAIFFSLVYSLLGIIVIFYIAKLFFNEKVGLLAAFLLSFFPLDVLFSTRLMPDIVVSFYMWLGMLLFFIAEKIKGNKSHWYKKNILLYFLSGLSFGLGYLAKISIFLVLILFVAYFFYTRKVKFVQLFVLLGFLAVFISEGLYFAASTGDFFLNYHISNGVYDNKIKYDNIDNINLIPNILRIWYLDGSTQIFYLPTVLGILALRGEALNSMNYFGLFYYLVFFSVAFLLCKKVKRSYLLVLSLISIFLYLELGPTFLRFFEHGSLINFLILKKARILMALTTPALILVSLFLTKLKYKISTMMILILFLSSLIAINTTRDFFVSGVSSIKEAANFLETQPDRSIYADHMAAGMLEVYLGNKKRISGFPSDETAIKDAYIVDYGSRGMDISPQAIESIRPKYLRNATNEWMVVKVINNPSKKFAKNYKDLIIYSSK